MASPRLAALVFVALAGCTHVSHALTHATARLQGIRISGARPGELQLVARWQLDGLPLGAWRGDAAQLTLSLNDMPFSAVVSEPRLLPGDVVEVPVDLAFSRPQRDIAVAWAQGLPLRVRLRGRMMFSAGAASERVPTDVEQELVLPVEALPPPPRI